MSNNLFQFVITYSKMEYMILYNHKFYEFAFNLDNNPYFLMKGGLHETRKINTQKNVVVIGGGSSGIGIAASIRKRVKTSI